QAGKFRPLAVTSLERSSALPNVPTVAQSVPGYEAGSFLGIAGPAGMPGAIVERVNREVRRVLALPDVSRRFAEWGGTPSPGSPEEMRHHVEGEIAKWKRLVEATWVAGLYQGTGRIPLPEKKVKIPIFGIYLAWN
ncbi:MAG: hypothetical protein E6H80_13460, partial [Betaproteobacteria bacterium]